jgi:acetylornithine deacetylase/succinyl-diaminopimelate desuccinylase-like protein
MTSRETAVAGALAAFDSHAFRDHLAELVAIPSTSQDPGHEADVHHNLAGAIRPWLERMGFTTEIHPQSHTRLRPDPVRRTPRRTRPP